MLDLFSDLLDRNRRRGYRRQSGLRGVLTRLLGGDAHRDRRYDVDDDDRYYAYGRGDRYGSKYGRRRYRDDDDDDD